MFLLGRRELLHNMFDKWYPALQIQLCFFVVQGFKTEWVSCCVFCRRWCEFRPFAVWETIVPKIGNGVIHWPSRSYSEAPSTLPDSPLTSQTQPGTLPALKLPWERGHCSQHLTQESLGSSLPSPPMKLVLVSELFVSAIPTAWNPLLSSYTARSSPHLLQYHLFWGPPWPPDLVTISSLTYPFSFFIALATLWNYPAYLFVRVCLSSPAPHIYFLLYIHTWQHTWSM